MLKPLFFVKSLNLCKLIILFCFALVLFGLNVSSLAQDEAKVLEEIAGTYEYEFEGQVLVVIYTVEDGVLYGTEENDPNPPSRLDPIEGKELVFETTGDDGNLYVISFSRLPENVRGSKPVMSYNKSKAPGSIVLSVFSSTLFLISCSTASCAFLSALRSPCGTEQSITSPLLLISS